MLSRLNAFTLVTIVGVGFAPRVSVAQTAIPDDAVIDQIRGMSSIGSGDQSRILRWIQGEVETLIASASEDPVAAYNHFRERLNASYQDPRNTAQFRAEYARQLTDVAERRFTSTGVDGNVTHALARVLVDVNREETTAALLACLKSSDERTRCLCVKGLGEFKTVFAQDTARLGQVVAALKEAGLAESSPTVLAHIYAALAYTNQVGAVFDAYMAVLDKRLDRRRGPAVFAQRAEVDALDFFRSRRVLDSLSAEQKAQLVSRLAVFLRMDAQRYTASDVDANERNALERRLDGIEACFEAIVGAGRGGSIRDELREGGYERRDAVLQQAYRWVGNPSTQAAGALNASPWNVPIGAP